MRRKESLSNNTYAQLALKYTDGVQRGRKSSERNRGSAWAKCYGRGVLPTTLFCIIGFEKMLIFASVSIAFFQS